MKRVFITTVEFKRAFRLNGVDGLQPPGLYTTIAEDESLDSTTTLAWHRTKTMLRLPAVGTATLQFQDSTVNADELRDALQKDCNPARA